MKWPGGFLRVHFLPPVWALAGFLRSAAHLVLRPPDGDFRNQTGRIGSLGTAVVRAPFSDLTSDGCSYREEENTPSLAPRDERQPWLLVATGLEAQTNGAGQIPSIHFAGNRSILSPRVSPRGRPAKRGP